MTQRLGIAPVVPPSSVVEAAINGSVLWESGQDNLLMMYYETENRDGKITTYLLAGSACPIDGWLETMVDRNQFYRPEDFDRVLGEMTRLGVANGIVAAALQIAARAMTPLFITEALLSGAPSMEDAIQVALHKGIKRQF